MDLDADRIISFSRNGVVDPKSAVLYCDAHSFRNLCSGLFRRFFVWLGYLLPLGLGLLDSGKMTAE